MGSSRTVLVLEDISRTIWWPWSWPWPWPRSGVALALKAAGLGLALNAPFFTLQPNITVFLLKTVTVISLQLFVFKVFKDFCIRLRAAATNNVSILL